MEGNIFTAVIFNTIDDVVVWQDSLNSNDYKENEYNAALNIFFKSFMSRAGQNGIEFSQTDFLTGATACIIQDWANCT
jgi:hypothetical protein